MKTCCIAICIFLLISCTRETETVGQVDSIPFTVYGREISVFTTAAGTDLRLEQTAAEQFHMADNLLESEVAVLVNPEKQYQQILGIGGALTDAAAEVFAQLSEEKQQELMRAYYNEDTGIGYTLARTPIHSCDFSSASYTYIEEGDSALATFSIDHDRRYKLPLIKKAMKAAGGKLTLYASPWSPPAFMKSNGNMLHGGKLLPDFYQSWANYYVKFIRSYESEGIPVWGVTIQNEPMAKQIWESCLYSAEEERDFLKNYLGPTFEKEGFSDKKIIVWDHNRDFIAHRANVIFSDPDAAKYAWGIGFHWYEPWAGGEQMFSNLDLVREAFPEKKLIFTEGTTASFREHAYQTWEFGEKYGYAMINDFNSGTVGWTDWNILLDQRGGPNHVGNFCMAPVHADLNTGELIYTPSYYYIGHFSKFIRPGARRVSTGPSRSHLQATSFIHEKGTMITVVMNRNNLEIPYKLIIGGHQAGLTIPPHAIQTLLY
jgi:glucosylceramidase